MDEKNYLRIIERPIKDLKPYINNPRKNEEAVATVEKSIKEFGFINPIVLDKDDTIIVGHTRLKAAIRLGYETVPTIKVGYLTPEQVKAFRIMDNKSGEKAEWDMELLKEELHGLEGTEEFDATGFVDDEITDIWEFEEDSKEAHEDDFVEPKKAKYSVNRGDVFILGQHRLMCGDATDFANVKTLIGDEKVDMVFTDPPYGIDVNNTNGKILGDSNLNVFSKSLINIKKITNEHTVFYIYFGVQLAAESILEIKKYFPQTNILIQRITHENRPSPIGQFKSNYELCYFSNPSKKHFNSGIKEVSESTKNDKRYNGDGFVKVYKALTDIKATEHNLNMIHPTQKTVNICAFYQKISSKPKQTVLDLFGGSGSTLIACEQTDRKCYMMELDEYYVSVIIERWEKLTGQKAKKLNGGFPELNGKA